MEEKTMGIDEAVAALKGVKADESITIVLAENTTQLTSELHKALARGEDCCKVNLDLSKTKITEIGVGAFSGCTSLVSVTIPDSVTVIGEGSFSDCTSLASVTIPDSVTSIGVGAFSGFKSLANVTIPDSVTVIGSSAFDGLAKVKYKGITDTLENICHDFFCK